MADAFSVEGMMMRNQIGEGISDFVGRVPTMSPGEMGYYAGYISEQVVEGVLFSKGVGAYGNAAKSSSNFLKGGKTFSHFKSSYWAPRTKPTFQPIRMSNGKVFKVHMELHHRFIPQRANWAPNWLKNNSLNLQPLNTIQHGIRDPYRFSFFP